MIDLNIAVTLPPPWQTKRFETNHIGAINFLVGPNGSGKSRFASTLKSQLRGSRILGTDRLSGMEQTNAIRGIWGDHFANGFAKNNFQNFKNAGEGGSGIDTTVLLEERLDLRIQVEATLSHLFNRNISLDWDSGHLVPRATYGSSGTSYRLDREECHGIKELFVLLTHLYNDEYKYLIIDEPELNLHPQYQAFFLQEVRKVAGDPTKDPRKKAVFLITHSPFILDFKGMEDIKSVISFKLDHSVPRQLFGLEAAASARMASIVPRLNVHHKQLFFSDNPIFVEGILDAQLIGAIQEARGVSVVGAGSCIIDVGGCEEVNRYLELCKALGKDAHFVYDLDSLFGGNLRACLRDDGTVLNFLAKMGLGGDFGKYCGELDRTLTGLIDLILAANNVPATLTRLVTFLQEQGERPSWDGKNHAKARVAVITAMSRQPDEMAALTSKASVEEVQGRLSQIVAALKVKNVHLLPGGTLERYLPSFAGDHYELSDESKRQAVFSEIEALGETIPSADLERRYGDLYKAISALPSKVSVDVDRVLREYLSRYIHDLQLAVVNHPTWQLPELQAHLGAVQKATSKVFSISQFVRSAPKEFTATIGVAELLGQQKRRVKVTHNTNAGMTDFLIEIDAPQPPPSQPAIV